MPIPTEPLTVKAGRWLRDDDDCAIMRFAVPAVGIELTASLAALPLDDHTCYTLLLYYDNGQRYVEFVKPLSMQATPRIAADCAQSLQLVLNSEMFIETVVTSLVAHMRASGLLAGPRAQS